MSPPASLPHTALLFSIFRDYNPAFAAAHPAEQHRYTLALTSWLTLASSLPSPSLSLHSLSVHVFVDSSSSCDHLRVLGVDVACHVLQCAHAEFERPLMDCVWQLIGNASTADDVVFVNGDIVLFPSFLSTLALLHSRYDGQPYAAVARRHDLSFTPLTATDVSPQAIAHTEAAFLNRSTLHDAFGIDVFVVAGARFAELSATFPPFLVGVYRWDNWVLAALLRTSSVSAPVVDVTGTMTVGHDDVVSDHLRDDGREYNDDLVKAELGRWYRVGNIDNADVLVVGGEFRLNTADRTALHVFRRASRDTLGIVPVSARDFRAPQPKPVGWVEWLWGSGREDGGERMSPVDLWLCNARRLGFREWVWVAEDAESWWRLLAMGEVAVVINVNRTAMHAEMGEAAASSLTSFAPPQYPALFSSLFYVTAVVKAVLALEVHALVMAVDTALLSHPLTHVNASCDVQAGAGLGVGWLFVSSFPPPHHQYGFWMLRKVEECQMRAAEDVLDEERKRRRKREASTLIPDEPVGDVDRVERYALAGDVGRTCLREVVTYQLQPLPSFVLCVEPRVQRWQDVDATRDRVDVPFPYALVDEADASPTKAFVRRALGTCPPPAPPASASESPPVVRLHVHVRKDASDQAIRLFLRSLVLADYSSLRSHITATFDITALAWSSPPNPLHLSTRFGAIVDDYSDDVEGLSLSVFSPLQRGDLDDDVADAATDRFLVAFTHGGEEYIATRAVDGGSGDVHLFVDSGMLMPRAWYEHYLAALVRRGDARVMALSLFSATLPPALNGSAALSQTAFLSPVIAAHHSLLGLLLPSSSLRALHAYREELPGEACVSEAMTLSKALMRAGGYVRYAVDMARTDADDDDDALGLVDARGHRVSGGEALAMQYALWSAVRRDPCTW